MAINILDNKPSIKPLPLSLATTNSISIDFFSSYLDDSIH